MEKPNKVLYFQLDENGQRIPKLPEKRQYLLLLFYADGSGERFWDILTGRQTVIEYLIERREDIDFQKSMILVDTQSTFTDAQMLIDFVQYVCDHEYCDDASLGIFEEILAESIEEEE